MKAGLMDAVVDGRAGVFDVAGRLGFDGVELSLNREDLRSGDPAPSSCGVETPRSRSMPSCSASTTRRDRGRERRRGRAAAEDVRTAVDWAGRLGVGAILVPFFMRAQLLGEDA